jgi:hypothetical protein
MVESTVEILDGVRFDITSGREVAHRGTRDWLISIDAQPIEKSAKRVPASAVDRMGKYQPKREDN